MPTKPYTCRGYRIRTCVQLSPRQPAKTTSVNLSYLLVLRKRVYYKTFEYKLSRQSNLLILSIPCREDRIRTCIPLAPDQAALKKPLAYFPLYFYEPSIGIEPISPVYDAGIISLYTKRAFVDTCGIRTPPRQCKCLVLANYTTRPIFVLLSGVEPESLD